MLLSVISFFFFFNDTATTEIYTLSLHDALPIYLDWGSWEGSLPESSSLGGDGRPLRGASFMDATSSIRDSRDRKSTRLNSSHSQISYAVFCLKKKNK